MYVYVYIYIYIYIHNVCMYTYIYIYIHICIHTFPGPTKAASMEKHEQHCHAERQGRLLGQVDSDSCADG